MAGEPASASAFLDCRTVSSGGGSGRFASNAVGPGSTGSLSGTLRTEDGVSGLGNRLAISSSTSRLPRRDAAAPADRPSAHHADLGVVLHVQRVVAGDAGDEEVRRGAKPACGVRMERNGPNVVLVAGEATLEGIGRALVGGLGKPQVFDHTGNTDKFTLVLEYLGDPIVEAQTSGGSVVRRGGF